MVSRTRLWWQKRRWYERNRRPVRRLQIHREAARRGAYVRMPVEGNVLEAFRDGRLELGEGTLLEPGCWLTIADEGRLTVGEGCFLNRGTMVAVMGSVRIGDHVMFANNCFVTDANHRFDDLDRPVTWQGFESKGPTTIGSNCWFGINCVVTSGVTIGDRCVIGAGSIVTSDLPSGTISYGAPARVIREIDFRGGRTTG